MDVPLKPLNPRLYLCQVNIIDDVTGTFAGDFTLPSTV